MVSKKSTNRVDPTQLAGRREELSGHCTTVGITQLRHRPTAHAHRCGSSDNQDVAARTDDTDIPALGYEPSTWVDRRPRGARGLTAKMCADRS
jgi:hypothetical protein